MELLPADLEIWTDSRFAVEARTYGRMRADHQVQIRALADVRLPRAGRDVPGVMQANTTSDFTLLRAEATVAPHPIAELSSMFSHAGCSTVPSYASG
jgi:hypothetical protein